MITKQNFDNPDNFIVTSLPAYVENNRDVILGNFALVGPGTRSRISIQTGVKKSAYLNYLNLTPVLQDGSACGFDPQSSAELTQRTIDTAVISVELNICAKNLLGKWAEYLVRIGASNQELPFEQYIIDGLIAEVNRKIEKLIWQGDTTATTDPDKKWIDGFIAQFDADSDVVAVSLPSGTSIWDAVYAVYNQMTEEALARDPEIYVSPANYRAFILAMMAANLFHYAAPDQAYPDEIFVPGTGVKLVKTQGLAGVNDKIVGTFASNLVYGCDVEGDTEDIMIDYERKSKLFSVVITWNSGVAYYFPAHVTVATIAQ